ncbi:hypothetical protein [Streptomyces natalensis]|uniref:hypothetical protein n=1 Tax=Streptomyces natalensis TaxID=68242 RepID=UPI0012FEAED8|nr:hypothetical protein [Streptomyces natalensis]
MYSDAVAHFPNMNRGDRPDSTGADMPKDFCGIPHQTRHARPPAMAMPDVNATSPTTAQPEAGG